MGGIFDELAKGRDNNFLLLRLIAATAVIVSHSYPIALGEQATEPLEQFGATLGTIAVWAFFGVSGFLILKSYEHRPMAEFAALRAKRVFPALFVVSLLTAFLIGPLFTTLPTADYFGARLTWEYAPRALSLRWVTYALPGVFNDNPYPAVNGSLWTLYYEVFCYAALAMAGVVGLLNRFPIFLAISAAIYLIYSDTLYAPLCLAFVTGMIIYRYRSDIPACAILIPWALVLLTSEAMPAAIAATALWLSGLKRLPFTHEDYSYGVYIYGWPAQAILIDQMPWLAPTELTLLALPIALLCAAASWHLVEKPVMKTRFQALFRSKRQVPAL